jgi:poly-beta-hydroxyalkanoate depolymerase
MVLPSAFSSSPIATPSSASRHPGFGLEVTTIRGRRVAVRERSVLEKPFCRLVHFAREAGMPILPC